MSAVAVATGTGTFARGVHPNDQKKFAADAATEVLPLPALVSIALSQHTGAPCEAAVKLRQKVAFGEVVGNAKGFVSATVHSPVAGTVSKITVATLPNGRHVSVIQIKPEGENLSGQALFDEILGGEWPKTGLEQYTFEQMAKAVQDAGLVGLGGAAFPTHVKLTRNEKKPIDTLLLNGCECEPYLTADYRLMLDAPAPIVTGALLAAKACGATKICIVVEDNKPAAAEALRAAAQGTSIEVKVVHTKYPMGGEKSLIPAALNRVVPTGGLPLDVGVVVMNVGTAAALARAVLRGKPLTHRIVSVTGAGIAQPKNLLVPVGASYKDLIDFCGGLRPDAARAIAGGPMMGFALAQLDVPVTKGTSGITVLTEADVERADETSCVRCGRCVDVCPLNLVPTKMALASKHRDWDLAKRYHLTACCECGCCAYVCPAAIPLVQLMRVGKASMPRK
jgi:electron transport complex protein RnfC